MLVLGEAAADSADRVRAAIGGEQAWLTRFRLAAASDQVDFYNRVAGATVVDFERVRDRVLGGRGDADVLADWAASGAARQDALDDVQSRLVADLTTMSAEAVRWAQFRAWLALGLAGLYIGGSTFIALLVGRRLVRSLRELRDGALRVARQRLPDVSATIRAGYVVDPDREPPPFASPSRSEIGEVAAATNEIYRAAVTATYEVASVRSTGDVLRTLARRSLHLTRRQLKLITELERQEEDPRTVEKLFGIDHQATRMRRLAESLLVLAGEPPHRLNQASAPLFDILRAAAAEVEDYTRVQIRPPATDVRIVGPAVGDITHLLAELIENATAFSPAGTMVEVRSGETGQGWAVDIEDRGIGLDDETLARYNERLVNPPPFEPGSGSQIGLVVVARLAARHGVSVRLRRGVYHGVQAVVILPKTILETDRWFAVDAEALVGAPALAATTPEALPPAEPTGPRGRHALDAGRRVPVSLGTHGEPARRPVLDGAVMGQPVATDEISGLPPLPTRVRGAQMAEQLRAGPPPADADGASPARPTESPDRARQLAQGFLGGYARGQQEAHRQNRRP